MVIPPKDGDNRFWPWLWHGGGWNHQAIFFVDGQAILHQLVIIGN